MSQLNEKLKSLIKEKKHNEKRKKVLLKAMKRSLGGDYLTLLQNTLKARGETLNKSQVSATLWVRAFPGLDFLNFFQNRKPRTRTWFLRAAVPMTAARTELS